MFKSVFAKRVIKDDIIDNERVIDVKIDGNNVLIRTLCRELKLRDIEKVNIIREFSTPVNLC